MHLASLKTTEITITDSDTGPFLRELARFVKLPKHVLKAVGTLNINCVGQLMEYDDEPFNILAPNIAERVYIPRFAMWHHLVQAISDAGFVKGQVNFYAQMRLDHSYERFWRRVGPTFEAVAFVYRVLKPMLDKHQFGGDCAMTRRKRNSLPAFGTPEGYVLLKHAQITARAFLWHPEGFKSWYDAWLDGGGETKARRAARIEERRESARISV